MKNDFSDLFSLSSVTQFNKIPINDDGDIIKLINIGLHNITNVKIIKERHLHSHSFLELHYSLDGYAIYEFGDSCRIKLESNSWILIPEACPHKIIDYSDRYIKFSCSFHLVPPSDTDSINPAHECLSSILEQNTVKCGRISDFSKHSINDIYNVFFDDHPFTPIKIKGLTTSVVFDTLTSLCAGKHLTKNNQLKNDTRFAIAVQFIKDNIFRKIDIEDVARKVYLSPRQLDRIFKRNMSVSVTEFIFEQKCDAAKKMLTSTRIPIRMVSEKLGFSDPSYFNRFFKKRVGVTPNNFRKKDSR